MGIAAIVDDMVPGSSCVDVRNEDGVWEAAVVEKLSDTRTEVEVCGWESAVRKWFAVDDDRLAPFGTKSMSVQNPTQDSNTVVDLTAESSAPVNTISLDTLAAYSDVTWKETVVAGTLVDALTTTNHWVQVRHRSAVSALSLPS